jgi:hypothetical protein
VTITDRPVDKHSFGRIFFQHQTVLQLIKKSVVRAPSQSHVRKKRALKNYNEPGISVSIVSGYGLDDRAIEVRSLAEAKDFFV